MGSHGHSATGLPACLSLGIFLGDPPHPSLRFSKRRQLFIFTYFEKNVDLGRGPGMLKGGLLGVCLWSHVWFV